MYSKAKFKKLVHTLVRVYGVESFLNNIEDDMTQEEIDNDLWFKCPECQDVIYYDDWCDNDFGYFLHDDYFVCPICEEEIEY